MNPTSDAPSGRPPLRSRLASRVSREEEDLQDWLNGDGQVWLLVMAGLMVVGLIWRAVAG